MGFNWCIYIYMMGIQYDLMDVNVLFTFLIGFNGLYGDLMGVYGDSMGFNVDLVGVYGDSMVISWGLNVDLTVRLKRQQL